MTRQADDSAQQDFISTGPKPVLRGRSVRCPHCRVEFETMRRYQMACPQCGHAWEEDSVLSYRNSSEARIASLKDGIVRIVLFLVMLSGPLLLLLFFANMIFWAVGFGVDSLLFIVGAFVVFAVFTSAAVFVVRRRHGVVYAPGRLGLLFQQINWPKGPGL